MPCQIKTPSASNSPTITITPGILTLRHRRSLSVLIPSYGIFIKLPTSAHSSSSKLCCVYSVGGSFQTKGNFLCQISAPLRDKQTHKKGKYQNISMSLCCCHKQIQIREDNTKIAKSRSCTMRAKIDLNCRELMPARIKDIVSCV